MVVDPIPMRLVSLREEEIKTHIHTEGQSCEDTWRRPGGGSY